MKRKKNNLTVKGFVGWSLTFTKQIILLTTIIFFTMTIYDATMITIAIFKIGNFSYLDTFITELNETFRVVVGVNICGKVLENIFHYNSGGIFGESVHPDDIQFNIDKDADNDSEEEFEEESEEN